MWQAGFVTEVQGVIESTFRIVDFNFDGTTGMTVGGVDAAFSADSPETIAITIPYGSQSIEVVGLYPGELLAVAGFFTLTSLEIVSFIGNLEYEEPFDSSRASVYLSGISWSAFPAPFPLFSPEL